MRKYVLNIDKMYSGTTANALVLNQVDSEFPILIDNPPIGEKEQREWIDKWKIRYPEFDPYGDLNDYVLDFNLRIQHEFKNSGHCELYMMDDTNGMKCINNIPCVHIHHVVNQKMDIEFKEISPKTNQIKRLRKPTKKEKDKYSDIVYGESNRLNKLVHDIDNFVTYCEEHNYGFDYPHIQIWNDLLDDSKVDLLNSHINSSNQYVDGLNDYIMKFNATNNGSLSIEKKYMHTINGLFVPNDGREIVSASQMNVLFPMKKMSIKSLYASQLNVESDVDIDDTLEKALGITLMGQVSYKKCLQGMASRVGNNIYAMTPNVDVLGMYDFKDMNNSYHSNGFTVVNGMNNQIFPHTITFFQPSQEQYKMSTVQDFIDWYERHNHKVVVTQNETYGNNVSTMRCLGAKSYELELGTYCPDGLVFQYDSELSSGKIDYDSMIRLNSDTFRKIRHGNSDDGKYEYLGESKHHYVLNNKNGKSVGLLFNLYDSFISGNERILKINIPKSKDFNSLTFMMSCHMINENLIGDLQGQVFVNDQLMFDSSDKNTSDNPKKLVLMDSSFSNNEITISVIIHHNVDYNKRNSDHEYRSNLIHSGIVLNDIWLDDGLEHQIENLTFGSYVNEDGISEDERNYRYDQFWEVSQYKKNISYQTVMESSLKNTITNGLQYSNNYSSGDLYGDVFSTKSFLDSMYDMNIDTEWFHVMDDGKLERTSEFLPGQLYKELMRLESRDYIGIGNCSNQLYLVYNPTSTYFEFDENRTSENVYQVREKSPSSNDLNYQMVEVVKNINRFESSIKHKSNVFSVVVENTNLAEDKSDSRNEEIEKLKEHMRNSISQFVRDTCKGITPAHTQLFDVQFK